MTDGLVTVIDVEFVRTTVPVYVVEVDAVVHTAVISVAKLPPVMVVDEPMVGKELVDADVMNGPAVTSAVADVVVNVFLKVNPITSPTVPPRTTSLVNPLEAVNAFVDVYPTSVPAEL